VVCDGLGGDVAGGAWRNVRDDEEEQGGSRDIGTSVLVHYSTSLTLPSLIHQHTPTHTNTTQHNTALLHPVLTYPGWRLLGSCPCSSGSCTPCRSR
jgi:hypothetical protein